MARPSTGASTWGRWPSSEETTRRGSRSSPARSASSAVTTRASARATSGSTKGRNAERSGPSVRSGQVKDTASVRA